MTGQVILMPMNSEVAGKYGVEPERWELCWEVSIAGLGIIPPKGHNRTSGVRHH
jgi:hypothetical protein